MAKHEKDQEIRDLLLERYAAKTVKDLPDADIRFIAVSILPNLSQKSMDGMFVIRNPFTQQSFQMNPVIGRIITFIQECDATRFSPSLLRQYNVSEGAKIQTFDRARYLVAKLDRDLFYALID